MDEQRLNAYLNLVQLLLTCPNGQEGEVLNANQELIDAHLVLILEQVAEKLLVENGNKDAAAFLENLAFQIKAFLNKLLGDESSENYLTFLLEILQAISDSDASPQAVYPILQSNIDKLNTQLVSVLTKWGTNALTQLVSDQAEFIASTLCNFGIIIQLFPLGSRADNLEIAMAAYEIAIMAFGKESYPLEWSNSKINLGRAYYNRIRGERSENLENAIACYQAVLEVYTCENFPEQWASLQNSLGNAYSDRIRGDKADNVEIAIACYQSALQVYTPEAFPEQWATTQNNLGAAYSYRIFADRSENLEKAIHCYQNALQIRSREDFPQEWAATQNNLATFYNNRIRGDRADNLEMAICCYQNALQVYTREAFPSDWAMIQNNLGNVYFNRIKGHKFENLEIAIECYIQALQVRTLNQFPENWATTQNNLGTAYSNRIRGDKADNLERAIACYAAALTVYTREAYPEDWATTQNNLANAYLYRIRGDRTDNIEQAIAFYSAALEVYTREAFPKNWAMTQNNLANAYRNRIRGERADNLEMAIAFYTAALQVRTREAFPENWAMTQNNLAAAYSNRIRGERADNLEMAIAFYSAALEVYTREAFPQNYAETLFNLGLAYREVPNLQLAYNTFADAINTVEFLRGEIYSGDEAKKKLAEEYNQIYQNMVEVCIELKNYTVAIEYAERSKARNLVELLANCNLYPKGDLPAAVQNELQHLKAEINLEERRFAADSTLDNTRLNQLRQRYNELYPREGIKFDQIQQLIDDQTAIIEWYLNKDKFVAFVITSAYPPIQLWESSEQDLENLIDWVEEYLQDYGNNKSQWREQFSDRLQRLAQILHIDQIISYLQSGCNRLILIPHRFLHLLPLHALPLTAYQHSLLDHFPKGISYAPSCQMLQLSQNRNRPDFKNFFAIQNPNKDLNFTDIEVEAIRRDFEPNDDVLAKESAKKEALNSSRLLNAHCVHFSCHGYFNFESPLDSALVLAGATNSTWGTLEDSSYEICSRETKKPNLENCLTLREIFKLDLSQCRLVVLSACETGLIDFSSQSDEYIGLPSGFLVAGSTNVVSSLWAVDDFSTSFLMIKFYENLQSQNSVATALCLAQIWLRDATISELKQWIDTNQLPLNRKEEMALYLQLHQNNSKPFQEPYYWAAFCTIGQS
ncbi:CHAT domain-containing tetratricopeptide repeat protein [Kamptonema sp. UHCC 0994]|uniref:CHAT domain-containing protein n=1 Tax=Kamptonema sp. UHCC 0994 TaxID=3031329 RepID=UPI0023BA0E99|nr:CHAT domain-containing tetratricopeptide repeat protein [Kamptonema sp. UHCC 0994]MDF0555621.1 CHAT domain-containing protein [Kamptonema sp. UHCC 0994]